MASDQFGPSNKAALPSYAQLCRLLVDCGSQALRLTFDNIYPPGDLYTVLSHDPVQRTLKFLWEKKILSPAQWEMLYPVIPSVVTSANFDPTLLMVLLRSICHLRSPANGWDNFPSLTDKNLEDDIARIRCYRNLLAHSTKASFDCSTCGSYWQDIHGILMRLGLASYGNAIDQLKSSRMDPDIEEHYELYLRQWERDEDDIKKKLLQMKVEVDSLMEKNHHGDAAYPANLIDNIREVYKVDRGWRSPFPWCEEFNVHLDDITVRLSTSSMKTIRKMSTVEIDMSDIFKAHDGCTQQSRVVLIHGNSGYGKTTFCQKVCYDWAMEQQTKVGLPKFELVLLLKCHDIKGDLWEAIDDQLLPNNISPEERKRLFQYIRNSQSNVLLVLDGLDELPSNKTPLFSEILKGRDLPNCKILATSQETAGKEVENLFDTLLEMQGFNEEDAKIFILKHFKRIRPWVVEELLHKAKPNHMFKDRVVNPLTTALLCLLCGDFKGHLPESKTQLYLETTSSVLRRYSLKEGVFTSSENFIEIYKAELLQLGSLAFSSLLEKKRYLEENALSSDLLKIGFLSTESSHHTKNSRYFFIHKSIQEFLAAFYLSHQLMCGEMDPEVVVIKHFHELKGVLSFTTGLMRKEDTALCLIKSLAVQINRVNINKDKELFHSEDYLRVSLDCIGECVQENRSELVRCLGSHLTIEEVAFRDGSSGDSLQAELLKANKTLKKLKLCKSGNRSDWDNIPSSLAEVLQSNTTLTNLELSGFGEEDALQIFEVLKTNTTLNRLQLCGSIIGACGAYSLAMSLKVNSSLTTLDLSDNEIGFSGVGCLAEVLKVNTALTKLNLSANNIGDLAAVTLSESLKSNTTLTSLYLSSNSIGVYGVRSLVEALTVNASLVFLDLSGNEIGDTGAVAIAQALKENTGLAVLNLSQNGIGDVAALVIAEALKTNASLTTLGLQNNKISSSGAMFLADALKVNTKLSSLDLSTNYIDDTGASCLAEALKHKE